MENLIFLSYDILPMYSGESDQPFYAASLMERDGKIKNWSKISRKKLLKTIRRYKPDCLGTDNPNEILHSNQTIAGFCEKLPENTSFVHVNLAKSGISLPLRRILQSNNLASNHKLIPLETANMLNQLMKMGIGMILDPFESETIIHIGRPKSHKKGGWSQSRFAAQNEEVVYRVSEDIKNRLNEEKLSFDHQQIKTKHGAKWSRYYIFHKKREVTSLIKDVSFHPAKVKIWRPHKNIVTHKPLRGNDIIDNTPNEKNNLIIGIDPGMETGISIINLKGEFIHSISKKNFSRGDIISEISKYGIPVIIASDVSPAPMLVRKIASNYHALLIKPNRILNQIDKKFLISRHGISEKLTTHIQDALSAAIYAYNLFKDNFVKIELSKDMSDIEKAIAKQFIIQGLSVSESIRKTKEYSKFISENRENSEEIKIEPIANQERNKADLIRLNKLENEVTYLNAETNRQRQLIKNLNKKIESLNRKRKLEEMQLIRSELEKEIVQNRDRNIETMKSDIQRFEKLLSTEREKTRVLEKMLWITMDSGGYPIKVLKIFSNDGMNQLVRQKGLEEDDIILIEDPTGGGNNAVEFLLNKNLKMIFYENHEFSPRIREILHQNKIPNIRAEKYQILKLEDNASISKNNLELAMRDYNNKFLAEEAKRKSEVIDKTLENFYYERQKEIDQLKVDYENYIPDDE